MQPGICIHAIKHQYATGSIPPPTHKRGSKKIDHILVCAKVVQHTTRCGIKIFGSIIVSDHRALYLDIDMEKLLGGLPEDQSSTPTSKVSGKDPRTVIPFKEALYQYAASHNLIQWALELEPMIEQPTKSIDLTRLGKTMNEIDKDVSRAFTTGAAQCTPVFKDQWTPKIDHAHQKIKFYLMMQSEYRTKVDMSVPLAELAENI